MLDKNGIIPEDDHSSHDDEEGSLNKVAAKVTLSAIELELCEQNTTKIMDTLISKYFVHVASIDVLKTNQVSSMKHAEVDSQTEAKDSVINV